MPKYETLNEGIRMDGGGHKALACEVREDPAVTGRILDDAKRPFYRGIALVPTNHPVQASPNR